MDDDLESSSPDQSDIEFENGFDNGSDNDESND